MRILWDCAEIHNEITASLKTPCFFNAKNLRHFAQRSNVSKPFFKLRFTRSSHFWAIALYNLPTRGFVAFCDRVVVGYANRICVGYKSLFGYYGKFRHQMKRHFLQTRYSFPGQNMVLCVAIGGVTLWRDTKKSLCRQFHSLWKR